MKKCSFCENKRYLFTEHASNNKAEIALQDSSHMIVSGDDGIRYIVSCNYCPKCGRKLVQVAEKVYHE